jgi:guanylate kinase
MNIGFIGAKGTSKSTMEKLIVNRNNNIKKVISHTTREPRIGEVDGVDYHFVSREKFISLKDNNFFAEYVENRGALYGISKSELSNEEYIKCFVVDYDGLKQIRDNYGDIFTIYLECDKHQRIQRILNRDLELNYNIFEKDDLYFKKHKHKINPNIKIDTTNKNINDVYDIIIKNLKSKIDIL